MQICSSVKLGRKRGQFCSCMGSPRILLALEISALTRWSTTCVAAARGALPGALIKLTCALRTPRLSPLSSLERCLLHKQSKLPSTERPTVQFAGLEHSVSLWMAVPELKLTVNCTEDCWGKVKWPALLPPLSSTQQLRDVTPWHLRGSSYPTEHKSQHKHSKRSFLSTLKSTEIPTCPSGTFF